MTPPSARRSWIPIQNWGVLIIAGVAKPDRLKLVLGTGIATFIHKPYDLNELGTTLRYELDSRPPEKHAAGHGNR
jgi:hypothetical protein